MPDLELFEDDPSELAEAFWDEPDWIDPDTKIDWKTPVVKQPEFQQEQQSFSENPELMKTTGGESFNVRRWFAQENGNIPLENMTQVDGGRYLRPDVAQAWNAMKRSARKAGVSLTLNSAYRTREQQQALYNAYLHDDGNLAAAPGKSDHGWGTTIDAADSRGYAWLQKNAGEFGFSNTVESEPWHYEYKGGFQGAYKTKKDAPPRARQRRPQETGTVQSLVTNTDPLVAMPSAVFAITNPGKPTKRTVMQKVKGDKGGGRVPAFVPKKFRSMIADAARQTGLSPRLIAFVMKTESAFNPGAVSSAGAVGLMQVMPLHTKTYGNEFLSNARENVMVGASILAAYLKQAKGDLKTALAAYNAGFSNLQAGMGYAEHILEEMRR